MSNLPIDLKDRRVRVAIFAILTVVLVVNGSTFAPLLTRVQGDTPLQEDTVQLPDDLESQAASAARRLMAAQAGGAGGLPPGATGAVGSMRDPFRSKPVAPPVAKRTTASKSKKKAVRSAAPAAWHCEAVLLGSGPATALVNGVPLHTGDRFKGYRVEEIKDSGVWLRKASKRVFLPVTAASKDDVDHGRITGTGPQSRKSSTALDAVEKR